MAVMYFNTPPTATEDIHQNPRQFGPGVKQPTADRTVAEPRYGDASTRRPVKPQEEQNSSYSDDQCKKRREAISPYTPSGCFFLARFKPITSFYRLH
jgi:hypothetical protein